jgi:hypothetical protein
MNRVKFASIAVLLIFALLFSGCAGNKPPTASIDSPKDKAELANKIVEFKGTGTDPEKKPVTYSWDFGEGRRTRPRTRSIPMPRRGPTPSL